MWIYRSYYWPQSAKKPPRVPPLLIGRLINLIFQRSARTGNNCGQERNSNKRVETGSRKKWAHFDNGFLHGSQRLAVKLYRDLAGHRRRIIVERLDIHACARLHTNWYVSVAVFLLLWIIDCRVRGRKMIFSCYYSFLFCHVLSNYFVPRIKMES